MADNDTNILLEYINHQLKAVLEGQAAMASVPGDIREIKSSLTSITDDTDAILTMLKSRPCNIRLT